MREFGRRIRSVVQRAAMRWAGKSRVRVRQVAAPRRITVPDSLGITASNSSRTGSYDLLGIAAAILLSFTAACSWLPFAPRSIPDCPGAIRSTNDIRGDFTIREWVTVRAEGVDFPFELIVQKKERELVLIGLSPLGAKLFSIVQTGIETNVDALPGAVLPIPPLNVLRDLHQFRFSQLGAPISEFEPAVFDRADCGYSIRFETLSEGPP